MYNNLFKNTQKKISLEEIQEIEVKFKFKFPTQILNHYLEYNGGEPEKYIFIDEDEEIYIIQTFIPVKYGDEEILEEILINLRDTKIIPMWFIPIASDPSGNLYGFSIDEEDNGAIYYWNHEEVDDDVICLTDSFQEFMQRLVEWKTI